MATTKITKTQKFDMLLAIEGVKANPMLVEFIEHEKAIIAKKSNGKKSAKDSEATAKLKDTVRDILSAGEAMTISEILAAGLTAGTLDVSVSNQKVRSILGYMMEDGTAIRKQEGRKITFTLA